jgi:hypothetical protein
MADSTQAPWLDLAALAPVVDAHLVRSLTQLQHRLLTLSLRFGRMAESGRPIEFSTELVREIAATMDASSAMCDAVIALLSGPSATRPAAASRPAGPPRRRRVPGS